ncbi:MAG: LysR family transcriptional regulator [Pseudomonadota bacterium]
METKHIRFIRCVAEHGNISSASREIGITQPALTKIVSRVEDVVSAKLFERGPRGVRLTPLGRLFLERMDGVEREMHNFASEIQAYKRGIAGTVRLGVGQFWLGTR